MTEPDRPVIHLDTAAESNLLLVSCATLRPPHKERLFDFIGVTKDIPVKKLFLRDPWMYWYHQGIPGVGESLQSVVDYIRGIRENMGIGPIVTVGSSGGGYAAILIGLLINAREVHAFCPVTKLLEPSDTIHPEKLDFLHRKYGKDSALLDLHKLMRQETTDTKINIYYGARKKDIRHARHMKSDPRVNLTWFPYLDHHLATFLARKGELTRLLRGILTGNDAERRSAIRRGRIKAVAALGADLLAPVTRVTSNR
jgi:hypothetical protein